MKKLNKDSIKEYFSISKIKEMRKDKKGRAKLELALYFILFIIIILFARFSTNGTNISNVEETTNSTFLDVLKDNYEYEMTISINNDNYVYNGRKLGNNESIKVTNDDTSKSYYIMNGKYYEQDGNGNYILTTEETLYPYIDHNFISTNSIINFIKNSTKEDNIYKLKVSDIMLNSTSEDFVTFNVSDENNSVEIDYTSLLKLQNDSIENVNIIINFSNINSILSLEE